MAPRYGSILSAMLSYPNAILSERTVRRFMLSESVGTLSYERVSDPTILSQKRFEHNRSISRLVANAVEDEGKR